MGTFIVGAVILAAFVFALKKCVENVKDGKCAGGCGGCASACSCQQMTEDLEKLAKK